MPPEEFVDEAAAESSSAPQVTPAQQTPNGGAQTAEQTGQGQQQPPFHLHPRWQQLQREQRESRTTMQQLTQENQRLQQQMQALQKTATGPAYTQEQRDERQRARQIIQELQNEDPEYARRQQQIDQMLAAMPHLLRGYQGVNALTQAQQEGNVRAGRQTIAELAKKALPDNPKAADRVEDLVTGHLTRDPALFERFRAGDASAIKEAFDAVDADFLSHLRRQANAQVATAKQQTRNLPPRPGGGLPTEAAPPKLEEGKEREYFSALSKRSQQVLSGG